MPSPSAADGMLGSQGLGMRLPLLFVLCQAALTHEPLLR